MGKKIKKFLKKAAKAAIIGGALYGATKGIRKGLKKRALNKITDFGHDTGTGRFDQAETWDLPVPKVKTPKFKHTPIDPDFLLPGAKEGGRIGAKKGGLIKGKPKLAKRGWK